MNRRNFITTTSSIALGITAVTAGCLDNVTGPGGPDVEVEVHTSDGFDEVAEIGDPEISIEEREDDDDHLNIEFTVEQNADECIDVEGDITAYDEDDIVVYDSGGSEQYDPGETYASTHVISEPPSDIDRILLEFSINPNSIMCL